MIFKINNRHSIPDPKISEQKKNAKTNKTHTHATNKQAKLSYTQVIMKIVGSQKQGENLERSQRKNNTLPIEEQKSCKKKKRQVD